MFITKLYPACNDYTAREMYSDGMNTYSLVNESTELANKAISALVKAHGTATPTRLQIRKAILIASTASQRLVTDALINEAKARVAGAYARVNEARSKISAFTL